MLDRSKLVSHRLRGFGHHENCRSALEWACSTAVPCLEIDTRVAADGRIFVYHNPRGRSLRSGRLHFAETDSTAVRRARYPSGEPLLELDEALAIFRRRAMAEQRICIDMKDCGFEAQHLALAERHGVQGGVSWMAWVPQSLARIRNFGATGPLVLAHCNLMRLRAVGDWLGAALAGVELQFSTLVLRGVAHARTGPGAFAHGYQHGLLCTRLPPRIEDLLARSGGGICVHRSLVDVRLAEYCRNAGLQLWVFQVTTPASYARYAAEQGVSKVVCDDALAVLEAAGDAPRPSERTPS